MRVCNVCLIKICQAGRREMLWSLAATAVGLGMRPDSANAAAPASLESENVIRKGLQELRNEGLQVEELRQNSEAAAKDELQVLSVVAGTSTKQTLAFFFFEKKCLCHLIIWWRASTEKESRARTGGQGNARRKVLRNAFWIRLCWYHGENRLFF